MTECGRRSGVDLPSIFLRSSLVATLLYSVTADATNGYIPHGFGTNAKGMAGAGSALPQDAMTVYSNNAGLARLSRRFDVSGELFNPRRDYRANDNADPPPTPKIGRAHV